jgi:hypothetical protein
MMAWTAPRTWSAAEVVTAAMLNSNVRDNLLHGSIKQIVRREYEITATGYSTTSTTFVDVDATNLKADITLLGGNGTLLALCSLMGSNSNSTSYYDLVCGATRSYTSTTPNPVVTFNANSVAYPLSIIGFWTGLSVGLQTVKLQYRTASGTNPARVSQDSTASFKASTVQFILMEI